MNQLNPCPRCNSQMNISKKDGTSKSFPLIMILCSNPDCLWNMTCQYNEMVGSGYDSLLKKMTEQWNEGTKELIC